MGPQFLGPLLFAIDYAVAALTAHIAASSYAVWAKVSFSLGGSARAALRAPVYSSRGHDTRSRACASQREEQY